MRSFLILSLSLLIGGISYGELTFSPDDVSPIGEGEMIPDAYLTTLDGTEILLSEAIGGKPALLIFYRGGWCPYCMRHLSALKDIIPQVTELGYEVIAISPDDLSSVREAAEGNGIDYTILIDSNFELIQDFNLAFMLDEATQEKLRDYGITVRPMPNEPVYVLPVPAVYIVDANGVIQFLHYDPDYTQRMDSDSILDRVQRLSEE